MSEEDIKIVEERAIHKVKALREERDTLLVECRRFEGEYLEAMKELSRVIQERDRYKEALESLCYSIAGTEGTKTNAELPEWFRLRLKDARSALALQDTGRDIPQKTNLTKEKENT